MGTKVPQWWHSSRRRNRCSTSQAEQFGHSNLKPHLRQSGHRRIAAAVQKQERLLAARQASRRPPRPAPATASVPRSGGRARMSMAAIVGKAGRLVAGAEPDMPVAALLGVDQALDRGRGRAQHHGAAPERAAQHRHVARLIGDALLLLVALVVLLIDDDQAEIGEGQEQRGAGADHELRLVLGDRAPDAAAHRRRDAGMPFGGPGAEALLAAGDELAGERDLGHQHQHLLARAPARRRSPRNRSRSCPSR